MDTGWHFNARCEQWQWQGWHAQVSPTEERRCDQQLLTAGVTRFHGLTCEQGYAGLCPNPGAAIHSEHQNAASCTFMLIQCGTRLRLHRRRPHLVARVARLRRLLPRVHHVLLLARVYGRRCAIPWLAPILRGATHLRLQRLLLLVRVLRQRVVGRRPVPGRRDPLRRVASGRRAPVDVHHGERLRSRLRRSVLRRRRLVLRGRLLRRRLLRLQRARRPPPRARHGDHPQHYLSLEQRLG